MDYKEPDLTRLKEFIGPAFALAGLAILDSLLSCVVADNMTRKGTVATFGQGMEQDLLEVLQLDESCGAKTPLASIVHGYTLLVILLGLGFLILFQLHYLRYDNGLSDFA